MTRARRIGWGISLLGLALASVGAFVTLEQVGKLVRYQPVEATVVSASVSSQTTTSRNPAGGGVRASRSYEPVVRDRYEVDGRSFASEAVRPLNGPMFRAHGARALVAPFSPGQTTTAYVAPDDPSDAFLVRTLNTPALVMISAGLLPLMILRPPVNRHGLLGAIRWSALLSVVGLVLGAILALAVGLLDRGRAQLLGGSPLAIDGIVLGAWVGAVLMGVAGALVGAFGTEQVHLAGPPESGSGSEPEDDRVARLRARLRR